ncbi:MAG TPA: galactokinase [Vicinamibacterales bacterium]|nr:galactokinase [Vicinamibacterales bacterium]
MAEIDKAKRLIDREALRLAFLERYEGEPRMFRAPGRVNLIGEHTDYNGGFVLPMAIECETIVAAVRREERRVRVYSLNVDEAAVFDLDRPGVPRRGIWLDYVEGVARALEDCGIQLSGADLMILSDVPQGAGLSSSAALEVATGLALLTIAGKEIDRVALALAGQRGEHTYVGTLCGIMDQFVAALGRAGHALLIDCRKLEATAVPFDTSSVVVAICDTHVKHELSSSEYNTRRAECEHGVELLAEVLPHITQLRDVGLEEFARHEFLLPEPIRRRCRHVVGENERTLDAADALRRGDVEEVGRLMNRSHESLRDDYEVSCTELDLLVQIALKCEGVLGSRMTGAGFGGSTVNLVRREQLERFKQVISTEYEARLHVAPTIYTSEPGDGAREICI